MQKAKLATDGTLMFRCPGCEEHHGIPVDGSRGWKWNQSLDSPTVSPSILVRFTLYGPDKVGFHKYNGPMPCEGKNILDESQMKSGYPIGSIEAKEASLLRDLLRSSLRSFLRVLVQRDVLCRYGHDRLECVGKGLSLPFVLVLGGNVRRYLDRFVFHGLALSWYGGRFRAGQFHRVGAKFAWLVVGFQLNPWRTMSSRFSSGLYRSFLYEMSTSI